MNIKKYIAGYEQPRDTEASQLYALGDFDTGLLVLNRSTKQWERHDELLMEIMPGSGQYVYSVTPEEALEIATQQGCPSLPG